MNDDVREIRREAARLAEANRPLFSGSPNAETATLQRIIEAAEVVFGVWSTQLHERLGDTSSAPWYCAPLRRAASCG
jgi:hypothetical protein